MTNLRDPSRITVKVKPKMVNGAELREVQIVKWPVMRRDICETERELEILLSTVEGMCQLFGIPQPEVERLT